MTTKMVRDQMEADCKAVCAMCGQGDAPFNDKQGGWIHHSPGNYTACDAAAIRSQGANK